MDKPKIILTSFRDAKNWEGLKFSICPLQPYQIDTRYKEYGVAKPFEPPGDDLWKQNDEDMLEKYEVYLKNNRSSVELAIDVLAKSKENVVLLCWCNPERNGKEVFCHRTVLGKWITKHLGGKYDVVISDMGGKGDKRK